MEENKIPGGFDVEIAMEEAVTKRTLKKKMLIWIIAGVLVLATAVGGWIIWQQNTGGKNHNPQKGNIKYESIIGSVPDSETVFKVGDKSVSRDVFGTMVNTAGYSFASTLYSMGYIEDIESFSWDDVYEDEELSGTYNEICRNMALDGLIPVYAVISQGESFGIAWEEEDEKVVREWVDKQKELYGEKFEEQLKRNGYKNEQVLYDVQKMQHYRDKVYADMENDLSKYADLSELREYVGDSITATHILIMFEGILEGEVTQEAKAAAREKIQGIYDRIKAGEDFEALCEEFGEDPSLTAEGYTFYPDGEMADESGNILNEDFVQAALVLKEGNISGIIETDYGCHIVKRLSRKLTIEDYVKMLRETAEVTVNQDVYNSVNVTINLKDFFSGEEASDNSAE